MKKSDNNKKIIIRKAGMQNVKELMRLYSFLSSGYKENLKPIKMAFGFCATDIYITKIKTKVIGTFTLSYRVVPSFGKVVYIDNVVVDPDFRGLGIGKALILECLKIAKKNRCKRAELTSNKNRDRANKIYISIGFKKRDTNCYLYNL